MPRLCTSRDATRVSILIESGHRTEVRSDTKLAVSVSGFTLTLEASRLRGGVRESDKRVNSTMAYIDSVEI